MLYRSFVPFPTLTTERLTLRQLEISDQEEIYSLRSDGEVNKYLDRPTSKSVDDAREFINKVNENVSKNNAVYWAINLSGSNTLVGTICLFSFSDENKSCEIGYELMPGFQGRGIMKEAALKVIDYAFNTIRVQEIEASLHCDNQRSVNLLEKILFTRSSKTDETSPAMIFYHLTHPQAILNNDTIDRA